MRPRASPKIIWIMIRCIVGFMLVTPIIGCHYQTRPEYGVNLKLVERMPYADPPDVVVEFTRRW